MNRVLFIDCQLLQTSALHRGMGKYTLAVLNEYKKMSLPYDKVVLLLGHRFAKTEEEDFIESALDGFEFKRLPLRKTSPARPQEYISIVESNRELLDKYIRSHYSEYSVDFLITSIFQEDGCSAFPTVAQNKYLLIYDLIPLQFPDYYLDDMRGKYHYLSRYYELFKASHYFTISKTVANDLSLQLGIPHDRITAIDGSFISRMDINKSRPEPLKSGEKFILMPTGDDARKNNLRAAAAFEEFNSKSGYDYKLVVTSFFGDKAKSEMLLKSNHIIFTGNISESELAWLYENADLIFFPTEYEGLGMPALEAVEFGKPVLCSSIDVFKEISETAFFYCDPYDIDDMARQLQKLLINNTPKTNSSEYKRVLSKYAWSRTAKLTVEEYSRIRKVKPRAAQRKRKVAVFAPDPSGFSAIGKVVQEQHYMLSQIAEVDYYLEEGITDRAKNSKVRVNYLPYISDCKNPWAFDRRDAAAYDEIIYHVGNSEYHIATIVKALAYPATMVLHDTGLGEIFSLIKDRGYISDARYVHERNLQEVIGHKKRLSVIESNYIASLVNVSGRVITHSDFAAQAVAQMLIKDSTTNIERLNLPVPTPFAVYEANDYDDFVVGYAGVLHPAKGLDIIEDIVSTKFKKRVIVKLFGFSLLTDEVQKKLDNLANVTMIFKPTDTRFIHELETCDVIVGYRPDYHGETSLSTLEALRLGCPVIVNDVGWFKELPEGVVYKVKSKEDIVNKIGELISTEGGREELNTRVEYIRKRHGIESYVEALIVFKEKVL